MHERKKATDKLAKIFRINIGRTLKSIKKFITIMENLMMKEAARAQWHFILSIYHPPLTRAVVAMRVVACTPGIGC